MVDGHYEVGGVNDGLRCSYVGSGGGQIHHDDELFYAVIFIC